MTTQHEQRAGHDAIERMIEAIQGMHEHVLYGSSSHMHGISRSVDSSVPGIRVQSGDGVPRRHGAFTHFVRWWHNRRARAVLVWGSSETARIVLEREQALRALALAALEQIREDSARDLADRLDKSVEELVAQRREVAQIEGDREPEDPSEILKVLPAEYRDWFLADYRGALRAAYPGEGFLALQQMLRKWRLRAERYADQNHQREVDEAKRSWPEGEPPHGWRSREEVHETLRARGRPA